MTRRVIVHYHLYKNAGSSVESILYSNFGDRWTSYDSAEPTGAIFADELAALLLARPDLCAISSHQVRPPVPVLDQTELLPIVFLRHPLDRVQSIYDFDRRRGPVNADTEPAVRHDFAGYVRTLLDGTGHPIANFQTLALTDAWDERGRHLQPVSIDVHLDRASAFVDSLPVIGVVESWEASWKCLAPWLSESFPDFDVTLHGGSNASPERAKRSTRWRSRRTRADTLEARQDRMRHRLGTQLYERLEQANAADFELYERAVTRLGAAAER